MQNIFNNKMNILKEHIPEFIIKEIERLTNTLGNITKEMKIERQKFDEICKTAFKYKDLHPKASWKICNGIINFTLNDVEIYTIEIPNKEAFIDELSKSLID